MKNRNLPHSDNWKTPEAVYERLNQEFNFDFDPCPLRSNVGSIPPEEDGLLIEWGERNFINPPYSKKLKEAFVARAIAEAKKGKLCVLLLPVSTSTQLFHEVILPNAAEIRFVRKRIPFEGITTTGVPAARGAVGMHDSMIVVLDSSREPRHCFQSWCW